MIVNMKETKEKGVTLIGLAITITLLLIISSIGIKIGTSTIDSTKFYQFKEELKILQTKINELNQNNEIDLGKELSQTQKNFLNTKIISDIVYNGRTEEEKAKIQNGFKYFDNESLEKDLNLEDIDREYLINIEYRFVICYQGFKYNGTNYYMIDQIDDEIYNVRYKDKNPKEGNFEVTYIKENDRWKIEITNIEYSGYINNWTVKYRLDGDSYWNTANGLSFYVSKKGNYYVQVSHGDDINLGSKLVSIIDDAENENIL